MRSEVIDVFDFNNLYIENLFVSILVGESINAKLVGVSGRVVRER